jgi:hypothetical protein
MHEWTLRRWRVLRLRELRDRWRVQRPVAPRNVRDRAWKGVCCGHSMRVGLVRRWRVLQHGVHLAVRGVRCERPRRYLLADTRRHPTSRRTNSLHQFRERSEVQHCGVRRCHAGCLSVADQRRRVRKQQLRRRSVHERGDMLGRWEVQPQRQ